MGDGVSGKEEENGEVKERDGEGGESRREVERCGGVGKRPGCTRTPTLKGLRS